MLSSKHSNQQGRQLYCVVEMFIQILLEDHALHLVIRLLKIWQ